MYQVVIDCSLMLGFKPGEWYVGHGVTSVVCSLNPGMGLKVRGIGFSEVCIFFVVN